MEVTPSAKPKRTKPDRRPELRNPEKKKKPHMNVKENVCVTLHLPSAFSKRNRLPYTLYFPYLPKKMTLDMVARCTVEND